MNQITEHQDGTASATRTKVKVLSSSDPMLWYTEFLNKSFQVHRVTYDNQGKQFWVRTGDAFNTLNFIHSFDCEVILGNSEIKEK